MGFPQPVCGRLPTSWRPADTAHRIFRNVAPLLEVPRQRLDTDCQCICLPVYLSASDRAKKLSDMATSHFGEFPPGFTPSILVGVYCFSSVLESLPGDWGMSVENRLKEIMAYDAVIK